MKMAQKTQHKRKQQRHAQSKDKKKLTDPYSPA